MKLLSFVSLALVAALGGGCVLDGAEEQGGEADTASLDARFEEDNVALTSDPEALRCKPSCWRNCIRGHCHLVCGARCSF